MSIEALLSGADGADESIDLRAWKRRAVTMRELLWIMPGTPTPTSAT
ncbi:MAG: hypothetical protein ABI534_01800 [Chloroflexota bacterium]